MLKKKYDDYTCSYYNKFNRSHKIIEIINIYKKNNKCDSKFKICGRVFRKRVMGGSTFLEIKDLSSSIQLYLTKNNLKSYKSLITYLNLGDILGIEGTLFLTKTNELSLKVLDLIVLSKNLNTFPDKRFGLSDKESCYRQRYLDLIVNDATKNIFIIRSKIISIIRNFFIKNDYIEVETPIIQNIVGGADAKPFKTYHNYLNSNLYLRISPELHLKRLIVGGFEKVFEIGKNFRNENISNRHNPEFTTIEFYEAYSNYENLMSITETLFHTISTELKNETNSTNKYKLKTFLEKFNRLDFHEAISKYAPIFPEKIHDKTYLIKILEKEDIPIEKNITLGKIQSKIFEHFVEKKLLDPTFVLHHPKDISPLAKEHDEKNNLTERFELYINGKEIANGFSELNDPIDQEKRFIKQLSDKTSCENYDKDYVNALKYGLPPTAGEGIGLDRLVMLFTDSTNIKDVILFPSMRQK